MQKFHQRKLEKRKKIGLMEKKKRKEENRENCFERMK
jgi:hypothetical protein